MKKLTVYGLPITPFGLIEQLPGASFCVSYALRKRLGPQLDAAIRLVAEDGLLLVDNGAFTLFKQGVSTLDESYQSGFEAWAADILDRCPQAVAVVPDVIGGSEEQNADMVRLWLGGEIDPDRSMPVWHLNESLDYLIYLCESFGYVAFGSAGDDYWKIQGNPKWHARIKEAFAAIEAWERETGEVRPRVHMMRAQSEAHLYPFDSSDSSNVAVNHCRYKAEGRRPRRAARRADRQARPGERRPRGRTSDQAADGRPL